MKVQLLELYPKHVSAFKEIGDTYPDEIMYGPHLISPNDLYSKQGSLSFARTLIWTAN